MKRIVLMIAAAVAVVLSGPLGAADLGSDWRELVTEAYGKADIVMRGTVKSVEDQTMVDGGHVYSLLVTSSEKGVAASEVIVRAGGFFYLVPLDVGESVLMFLKSVNNADRADAGNPDRAAAGNPAYGLIEVAPLRPMVFLMSGTEAKPVDSRLGAEFSDVKITELDSLLASIKP